MKKALVVLLALAVVGGAFAADVGGTVIGNVVPVQGNTATDADITAGGSWIRSEFSGSGQNEEGTFGGWVRLRAGSEASTVQGWGTVWWKPIQQFQVQFGGNPDGFFAVNEVVGWGFYTSAGDVGVANNDNAWGWGGYYGYSKGGAIAGVKFNDAIYGGWGSMGALLTITPMEALAINIGIPFIDNNGDKAVDVYKRTNAQVAYTIDSIGRIAVTYAGGLMDEADPSSGSTIYGSFLLTAVENLTVNFGLGYKTPVAKRSGPLSVAVGADFTSGAFGIKARAMGQFMGSENDIKDPVYVIADILPSFAINDTLKANLSVGLGVTLPDVGDAVIGWHVNPYLGKAVVGGGEFFAGVKLWSEGGTDPVINWGVPIGMIYSF